MNAGSIKSMPWRTVLQNSVVILFLLVFSAPCFAADNASASRKSPGEVSEPKQTATTLQSRISDNSPLNRTRDENVAFVLMGVLVASVGGMFSKVGCTGLGIAGRLGLGLGGAFIGGMVVRVAEIDFAWGTITIGYEELLFSLLGAVSIVAANFKCYKIFAFGSILMYRILFNRR